MPATKTQLTGGGFQDAEGNVLALGYLTMRLSSDEEVTGVGQIAAGIVLKINLNSSGNVDTSPAQSVWANDVMTPANSFYIVTGYKANGQLAWGPNNEQVISGATFDTGTWVPNVVISWTYPAAFGPTGPTGPSSGGTGPPTPVDVLSTLYPIRVWKAVPNSGILSQNIGLAPDLTSTGNSLIDATATATNYNQYTTNASTTIGNQSRLSFTGTISYGITPNRGQIFSTQTLKAVKWQTKLVDTANVRIWMVMSDVYINNVANLVSDTPALNLIGFRYSTAAGDTTWHAVCSNGASQTTTDTGVAIDTVGHVFGIAVSQTSITFTIDNVTVATITTNIPANTVQFGDVWSVDNVAIANAKSAAICAFTTSE